MVQDKISAFIETPLTPFGILAGVGFIVTGIGLLKFTIKTLRFIRKIK